ncbi:MAG: tetratricopeptide repeat protein [Myxococcales bacterium]|nr:tetratricopeptide repeat protein [Myxococcales bacterium]
MWRNALRWLARKPVFPAIAALAVTLCSSPQAHAENPEQAFKGASDQIQSTVSDASAIEQAIAIQKQRARGPQQRIADAVLLMGVKDFDRAADVLNEVVEQYPDHATAFADGLQLLGETYFLSKQYLSAQRVFTKLVERGTEARFQPYRERAVIRLVDIALRLRDFASLDRLFSLVGQLSNEASSGMSYARGKGLLAQGKLDAAEVSLRAVAADSQFAHQAKYLAAVLAIRRVAQRAGKPGDPLPKGRYDEAVSRFREATKLAGDSAEHRHVIDLAWLGIGRLMFEMNQLSQSVEAFNRIDRTSPEFGTMLYELAWVYVRIGDFTRAQRALEVLAVSAPASQDVADAALLRADLMLRAGQFDKSVKVYESVLGTYDSMRERLDFFLGSTNDPGVFFDTLSAEQLELFESAKLPSLVLRWAREGDDGATAFALIDDLTTCRRLIKESNEMIERLNAVLTSPNKIRAIPSLKSGAERGLGLLNGIALARMRVGGGVDGVDAKQLTPELRDARAQRKALEQRLSLVPVTSGDFSAREQQAKKQWNVASQSLMRIDLEIDTLQATINGLERMLNDAPQQGIVRSPQQLQMYRHSLEEQKRLVAQYRAEGGELRRVIDAGKIQVGFGDKRFIEDEQVRKQYAQLLWKEVRLAVQGAGGAALAEYAKRLVPLLTLADDTEQKIEATLRKLYATVQDKVAELRRVVQHETQNVVEFSLRLDALDGEARSVVGGIAMRNFGLVRERLKNIVLRADVGITEEAWEVREEQQTRVRRLKVEKTRTENRLQEELDEVLDDSGNTESEED